MDQRYSGLTKVGLGVLACNSALAVFRSWGDAGSVVFVLAADVALLLLFLCLREFDNRRRGRAGGGGAAAAGTNKIKAAVWFLTTLLTGMFASRVAPLMPQPVDALVWLMAAATAAGGAWAMFFN